MIDTERGTVPWLAVALPSHWAPEDKVGRHFTDIHAPVADNQAIVRAADALLDLVSGRRQADERWERFVWTVSAQPRLHAHPARVDREGWQPSTLAQLPAGAWWRTERQTFIPLPDLGQAVFTVRVDVTPLAQVIDNAERAQRLHDALASMSDAVLAYRGLTAARAPLLAWLSSLA